MRYFVPLLLFCLFSLQMACDNTNVPLDAEARRMVDSLSAARIGIERRTIDSLCRSYNRTLLPQMVDSIKQVRLRQIEEQIKRVKLEE